MLAQDDCQEGRHVAPWLAPAARLFYAQEAMSHRQPVALQEPPVSSTWTEPPPWLVPNEGARCTLVCAASVLRLLGAPMPLAEQTSAMVKVMAEASGFREGYGPSMAAYVGGHSALDRGIERAGRLAGIEVRSRTRFIVRWGAIVASLDAGLPVVLNCYRAPSRQWSHSVLAVDYRAVPRRLLTLDPNDARYRWLAWSWPLGSWVCTATFIQPAGKASSGIDPVGRVSR